jgi:FtsP/CotA-like multicopper oxidase with cupredoxin domain
MIDRRNLLVGSGVLLSGAFIPRLTVAKTQPREFKLTAGPTRQALYRQELSDLWAYNNAVPGPEIRAVAGERIRVDFRNNLEEPTSIHWHGVRIENAMDGVPGLTQKPVQPGDGFVYEFIVPDSGTFWYHAHNKSWNQVGRGLYGPLIVDERSPAFKRDHDVTLVIDDWRLREPGVLDTDSFGALVDWSHGGRLGNWLLVNGLSRPTLNLRSGEAYRLRLINASNARVLEIDPNRFAGKVVAYDGQALPEPISLAYSPHLLGPSQRIDLVVVPDTNFTVEEISGDAPFPLVDINVDGISRPSQAVPSVASNLLTEPDISNARKATVVMEGGAMGRFADITYNGKRLEGADIRKTGQSWAFNGIANIADAPLFEARRGETIVLETINRTGWIHAMHVHGHHFRVLSRSKAEIDDGRPWRDTFLIGPEQTTEIAFVADNPGKWLYHCHMLEHAAGGMTTWFDIN